jgi:hypothetical protein
MRFILGIIGLFILPGAAHAFGKGIMLLADNPAFWHPLIFGLLIGLFAYKFLLSRVHGLITFEHEFTHAVISLLFFRKITRFVVTRNNGGYIKHSGGSCLGNHFITLAPYYFPTFSIFMALARPFIPLGWFPWYDLGIGFTFAYHTWSTFEEIISNWSKKSFALAGTSYLARTDIGECGYVFSGIMIAALNLLFCNILFFVITKGYAGITLSLSLMWENSLMIYSLLINRIYEIVKLLI